MSTLRELLKDGAAYLKKAWMRDAGERVKKDPECSRPCDAAGQRYGAAKPDGDAAEEISAAAENDARLLLFSAAGCNMTLWPLVSGEAAAGSVEARYREMLRRRAGHEPLQYITGEAPFYGRYFSVRPGVLIPRFDTETLVAAVLPELRPGAKILDMCCGSGCILITLMLEGPEHISGSGADISEAALSVAAENARRFHTDIHLIRSNLFGNIEAAYDIIVSNPPYIRSGEIAHLSPEVRDYEPREALDGDADGLSFYRKIIREAPGHLPENGLLAFEIGSDEAEDVKKLMQKGGFGEIKTARDLAGRMRCVSGRWRGNV